MHEIIQVIQSGDATNLEVGQDNGSASVPSQPLQWRQARRAVSRHSCFFMMLTCCELARLAARRDLVSGKLPKDGYLLGDVEFRQIIETYAEDEAIFTAVRSLPASFLIDRQPAK